MNPNSSSGPTPRTGTDRGSRHKRTTRSPLWGTGVRAHLRTLIAAINCRLDIHRWAVQPVAPGRHKIYCKDCGYDQT